MLGRGRPTARPAPVAHAGPHARSHSRPATAGRAEPIEGEYITNLQQQIYFLELELKFLYGNHGNLHSINVC